MKSLNWISRVGLVALCAASVSGCHDLVIKVQKKSTSSQPSDAATADAQQNGGVLNGADDTLKNLDDLRTIAAQLLIKQLSGQDFRNEVRTSIRKYRSFLIDRANQPIDAKLIPLTTEDLCKNGKLDLNIENQYLGVILKSALLAKLSEESGKALNMKIADSTAAIGQLVLAEIGLKVDGSSVVTRDGDTVNTTGNFTLQLLPFAEDSDATKAEDAQQILGLHFERQSLSDANNSGTFNADISISHAAASGSESTGLQTDVLHVGIARAQVDGKWQHTVDMNIGQKDSPAKYRRSLSVNETGEGKKVLISDKIDVTGQSEVSASRILDLGNLSQTCQTAQDVSKGSDGKPGDDGKPGASTSPSPSPIASVTPSPSPTTDPFIGEGNDKTTVTDPSQKPDQSPSQNKTSPTQK